MLICCLYDYDSKSWLFVDFLFAPCLLLFDSFPRSLRAVDFNGTTGSHDSTNLRYANVIVEDQPAPFNAKRLNPLKWVSFGFEACLSCSKTDAHTARVLTHLEVSIAMAFCNINHPFWGTPIYGNPHLNKYTLHIFVLNDLRCSLKVDDQKHNWGDKCRPYCLVLVMVLTVYRKEVK